MTNADKALAAEVLELLEGAKIEIRVFETFDTEGNYIGSRYDFQRTGMTFNFVSIEDVFDFRLKGRFEPAGVPLSWIDGTLGVMKGYQ